MNIKKVIKIGGSCLNIPAQLHHIAHIVSGNHEYVVVVSALKNITNLLERWYDSRDHKALEEITMLHQLFYDYFTDIQVTTTTEYNELIHAPDIYTRERTLALGEKMSVRLINSFLQSQNISIETIEGDPVISAVDTQLDIEKSVRSIQSSYGKKRTTHVIVQGFSSRNGEDIGNLGREGSDLTAVIWAYALGLPCALYKDVGGVYTADPKTDPHAQIIPEMTLENYQKDFFGAGVIYDKVILFCLNHHLDLEIRSFPEDIRGTIVHHSD